MTQAQYAYDRNGNRIRKETPEGTIAYTYDSRNRLATAGYGKQTDELWYDKAGNRMCRKLGEQLEHYTYDAANRLTESTKGFGIVRFLYDPAGNLLQDGKAIYQYDAFNRAVHATLPDGRTQSNQYDAEGLRSEVCENGESVHFLYYNGEVIAETSGAETTRYVRGNKIISSDAGTGSYRYYGLDEMGSTSCIIEEGEICNRYEYDAWGEPMSQKETVANRFQFTGEQRDSVTGQYYLRARYYSPETARFTQEDTYLGDGLNLYTYCKSNPVYYVDPSGRTTKTEDNTANAKVRSESETNQGNTAEQRYQANTKSNSEGNAGGDNLLPTNLQYFAQGGNGTKGNGSSVPMDWNEFQQANRGKYTNNEMSDAWDKYKKENCPNSGEHNLNRPYLRDDTVNGITRGRGVNGSYYDANTLEPIVGTPDIGHVAGHEFWRERDKAEGLEWTQSEFNEYMNNSDFYQFEDPSSNRSHKYEDKSK